MQLRERMREMRTMNSLTLKGLAERTGLSVSYLSDIERGRTIPSLATIETLAAAFRMTVIDLLTGIDFAGQQTEAHLPPGLAELREDEEYKHEITPEWIDTLSRIQLQGKRPKSKREWLELYLHLKRILEQ